MATDDNVLTPSAEWLGPVASWQQENCATTGVANKVVCCLGCGTGVEVLAAASLNASRVIALDYAEDALELCEKGAENYTCVETRFLMCAAILYQRAMCW